MSGPNAAFWGRAEWLVMAASCGVLLGTGLLAGAISLGACPVAVPRAEDLIASVPARSDDRFVVFRQDKSGTYRARVVINGVPLQMIVDTGASHSLLSESDARRVFQSVPTGEDGRVMTFGGVHPLKWENVASVEIAGRMLSHAKVGLMPSAPASVVGLNWLAELGPIVFDPGDSFIDR